MDIVTTYLYGSLDKYIHMKIPDWFKMLEAFYDKPRSVYSIKLQKYLYGLKQSSRMWYKNNEYLLEKGFENNKIWPCIFIKKTTSRFAIVAVYIDGLNLVGTPKKLKKTATYLKDEFEKKNR